MAYTAENWPITAALLQFPGTDAQGTPINDADASAWAEVLTEVKDAGFANADLTDSWVRPGRPEQGAPRRVQADGGRPWASASR